MKILLLFILLFSPTAWTQELTVAFGSCGDQDKPLPIWQDIIAQKPGYFIFTGDNVYPNEDNIKKLKKAYKRFRELKILENISQVSKVLAVWDDHDYAQNDGGIDFKYKKQSKELFLKAFKVSSTDERRQREGLYYSHWENLGEQKIHFIILDMRSFKSAFKPAPVKSGNKYLADNNPKKSLLGANQWAWLAEEIKKKSDLQIVVSSIQVLAEGHGYEKWGHLPLELEKLFKTMESANTGATVFLSGDRHYGSMYMRTGINKTFYEVTASGLNRFWAKGRGSETDKFWIAAQTFEPNYGLITINAKARTANMELKGIGNKSHSSYSIKY